MSDRDMHFGRSFDHHALEDACPCSKAPCGLVDVADPDCQEHNIRSAKTMRQLHLAKDCPGRAKP